MWRKWFVFICILAISAQLTLTAIDYDVHNQHIKCDIDYCEVMNIAKCQTMNCYEIALCYSGKNLTEWVALTFLDTTICNRKTVPCIYNEIDNVLKIRPTLSHWGVLSVISYMILIVYTAVVIIMPNYN